MVKLTKIYTRTGDKGTTSLGDLSRVKKTDARIQAMSSVDELNSQLGVVLSYELEDEIRQTLITIQNDLFDLGADIATPIVDNPEFPPLRVIDDQVTFLERRIDQYNAGLPKLMSFVLPSGGALTAHLHVARAVARRAERETWAAIEEFGGTMNVLTTTYLNRLSDLLFVFARYSSQGQEVLWVPGQNRKR